MGAPNKMGGLSFSRLSKPNAKKTTPFFPEEDEPKPHGTDGSVAEWLFELLLQPGQLLSERPGGYCQ